MRKINPCPFCGTAPSTYFRSYGTVAGYPSLRLFVECETCKICMTADAPCHMDQEELDYGKTPFESVEAAMDNLINRWNTRSNGTLFTADDVVAIMRVAGQTDCNKFKIGEKILYSPTEVGELLINHQGGNN